MPNPVCHPSLLLTTMHGHSAFPTLTVDWWASSWSNRLNQSIHTTAAALKEKGKWVYHLPSLTAANLCTKNKENGLAIYTTEDIMANLLGCFSFFNVFFLREPPPSTPFWCVWLFLPVSKPNIHTISQSDWPHENSQGFLLYNSVFRDGNKKRKLFQLKALWVLGLIIPEEADGL